MKAKKITPTSKQLDIMKEYWITLQIELENFYKTVNQLEKDMEIDTGIEGIEFIHDDMGQGIIGIGNYDRTMKLIQGEELEK